LDKKCEVQLGKIAFTYYRMEVGHDHFGLPKGNFWSPENIRESANQGLEYPGTVSRPPALGNIGRTWSYTWSRADFYQGHRRKKRFHLSEKTTSIHSRNIRRTARITIGKMIFFKPFWATFFRSRDSAESPQMASGLCPLYQLFNLGFSYPTLTGEVELPISFQYQITFSTQTINTLSPSYARKILSFHYSYKYEA